MASALHLGVWRQLNGDWGGPDCSLPTKHLVTHGVVVGMTGCGKTGLLTVLVEEAARAKVPTIVIDVKGDLPNLLLAFPSFDPRLLEPWVEPDHADREDEHKSDGAVAASVTTGPPSVAARAKELADARRALLTEWGINESDLASYVGSTQVRVLTPGSTAGEPLHMLSSLERRSPRWDSDPEAARDALSAAVSLVLRLIGHEPEPSKSKEHVLLSVLAERRLMAGLNADLASLMGDVLSPPISRIGALSMNTFIKPAERRNLAAALNTLLASPTFASWRQGTTLDVAQWMTPVADAPSDDATAPGRNGTGANGATAPDQSGTSRRPRTPIVIVSVAHLDDEERALVLGVLLHEVLSWVRTLPGSQRLRALLVFDEVYGFLPPHPANPPTKRPLVALMKQARGFGVGVVVATQNPMDLDYRALSNSGVWWLGRLQTDADRARVVEGLAASPGESSIAGSTEEIKNTLAKLNPRWFVVRNAHASCGPILMKPRESISLMRGPMTRGEIRAARGVDAGGATGTASVPGVASAPGIAAAVGETARDAAGAPASNGAAEPGATAA